GLHHIALLSRSDLIAAVARELEGRPSDPFDLVGVVDLSVDRSLLAVAEVPYLLRLAEIDAASEFTDDHDVEPFDNLRLERRSGSKRWVADRRTQIGVKAELLTEAQEPRFRANVIGNTVPFRTADGGQKDRVSRLRKVHIRVADRLSMLVVGA